MDIAETGYLFPGTDAAPDDRAQCFFIVCF
jgi:hypothetical protein